jgi:hypothetical protein
MENKSFKCDKIAKNGLKWTFLSPPDIGHFKQKKFQCSEAVPIDM